MTGYSLVFSFRRACFQVGHKAEGSPASFYTSFAMFAILSMLPLLAAPLHTPLLLSLEIKVLKWMSLKGFRGVDHVLRFLT